METCNVSIPTSSALKATIHRHFAPNVGKTSQFLNITSIACEAITQYDIDRIAKIAEKPGLERYGRGRYTPESLRAVVKFASIAIPKSPLKNFMPMGVLRMVLKNTEVRVNPVFWKNPLKNPLQFIKPKLKKDLRLLKTLYRASSTTRFVVSGI